MRQSNFELLRIVAIAFIILHHIAVHGDWGNGGMFFPEELTFNAVVLQGFFGLGKIGVNAFVLISGYFLFGSVRDVCGRVRRLPRWLLSCLVPFGSIFVMVKLNKALHAVAKEKGVKLRGSSLLYIITGIILPILPLNIIGLSVMQSDVNRIYNA